MTWLKVDDKFPRHRRIRELRGDTAAKWLHVTALCFCSEHLTDGRIDDVDIPSIIHSSELSAAVGKRCINRLVGVGLWENTGSGSYEIRDFLDYNPAAQDVKDLRAVRADAGRRGGVRSGASRRNASLIDDAERQKRNRATKQANTALKAGRIQIAPCSVCGSVVGLEMHHPDYDEPEEVVWLCKPCHDDHHKAKRGLQALASPGLEPQRLEPRPVPSRKTTSGFRDVKETVDESLREATL